MRAEVGLKLGNLEGRSVYPPVDRRTIEAYGTGLLGVKFKPFSPVCGDGVGKEARDRGQGSLSPCIWVAESAPHPLSILHTRKCWEQSPKRLVFKSGRGWVSMKGQWLGLHASNAGGAGSIPGRGTKIPHAMWQGPPKWGGHGWGRVIKVLAKS